MRTLLLAATLLAAPPALVQADPAIGAAEDQDVAFTLCYAMPDSGGPFGDGTPAGELFALYATEINSDVLIFGEPQPEAPATASLQDAWLTGPVRGATAR